MGRNNGATSKPHDIPEPLVIQMGHIHHHTQIPDSSHCLYPCFGQSLVLILRPSRSQCILLIPGQHGMPGSRFLIKKVNPVNVFPYLAESFHTGHHIDFSCCRPCLKVPETGYWLQYIRRLLLLRADALHNLRGTFYRVLIMRRVNPYHKDTPGHISLPEFFQMTAAEHIVFLMLYPPARYICPYIPMAVKNHILPPGPVPPRQNHPSVFPG